MAKKRRKDGDRSASTRPADAGSPPTQLTAGQQDERRDASAAQGHAAGQRQVNQLAEMRQDMMRSIITEPLLSEVRQRPDDKFDIIIVLNELFSGGMTRALAEVKARAETLGARYATVSHYCFACLTGSQILDLAREARELTEQYGRGGSVIYRIWQDSDVNVTLTHSVVTVKADAAQRAFHAHGNGIVWAVLDSGIEGTHPHFKTSAHPLGPIETLSTPMPIVHMDFTPDGRASQPPAAVGDQPVSQPSALVDRLGHGTHVAGIIAGVWQSSVAEGEPVGGTELRDESSDRAIPARETLRTISGVAPLCKLVSMKVIADIDQTGDVKQAAGRGKVSWILMAIQQIQDWNQNGRRILVHGVNMSVGYDFDPRWFACGHSPICVEVNRLVRCGVSVVVSAGNGGYSSFLAASGRSEARFSDLSITDPGNADLAVTVGSTHRDMPHTYGVSYFSSRG
ncbi:MAG TPA: S8 family serine peptidase, partial [Albitalea sp.]|nr:S8 family serine peptidase [Albitalea sp.]